MVWCLERGEDLFQRSLAAKKTLLNTKCFLLSRTREDSSGGCRDAAPSTFLQTGNTLPSANPSLEDAVHPIPTCKTGLLLLYGLRERKGWLGGGAEQHRGGRGAVGRDGHPLAPSAASPAAGSASVQPRCRCQAARRVAEPMRGFVIILMGSLAS